MTTDSLLAQPHRRSSLADVKSAVIVEESSCTCCLRLLFCMQHRAPQADSRRDREQERKRGRDDGPPSENGHARKRRTAEEPDAPRSRKGDEQAPSRKHRNDSRESSHERWLGGNASPVDVNDRWAG